MNAHADLLRHAADLLQASARGICNTEARRGGDWSGAADARADYDELCNTAHQLIQLSITLRGV